MNEVIRSTKDTNILNLLSWCREYNLNDRYPIDALKRFGVAFYQIYQGIDWKGDDNSNESYAASCIHLMLCSEKINLPIERLLPVDFNSFFKLEINWKDLLYHLSRSQQMLFYAIRQKVTQRGKSRYNEEKLTKDICQSISILVSAIPTQKRSQAIEDATTIMTGKL